MRLKYFLGLSIALNLALGAVLLLGGHSSQNSSSSDSASCCVDPGPMSPSDSTAAPGSPRTDAQMKASATAAADWIQALRHAGISEKVIADVAAADFESRWEKRSRENQKKFNRGEIDESTLARFDLEHDSEQEKELRAALGDEGFRRWDQTKVLADFDRAGVELTPGEGEELYDLRKAVDRKRLELDKARQQGKVSDEDAGGQGDALYVRYNEQLLKLLGEERYAMVQSGGNTGLGDLRRNLRMINSDETQVAGMESAQQAWNTRRGRLELQMQKGEVIGEEYEKQMKALDAERDQQYQQVLGADGFAKFQRTQDPRYQIMRRSAPALGLSDDDVNSLYTTFQNYESEVRDYRQRAEAVEAEGQAVDWPAVEKTLKEYSQQTETALRASLGDKFDKLKRNNVTPFDR